MAAASFWLWWCDRFARVYTSTSSAGTSRVFMGTSTAFRPWSNERRDQVQRQSCMEKGLEEGEGWGHGVPNNRRIQA